MRTNHLYPFQPHAHNAQPAKIEHKVKFMDSETKKDLVATGFVREYWNKVIKHAIGLPPDDIIKFIATWIHFMDSWDTTVIHPNIILSTESLGNLDYVECIETSIQQLQQKTKWCHCYGTDIIEQGMKKDGHFKF